MKKIAFCIMASSLVAPLCGMQRMARVIVGVMKQVRTVRACPLNDGSGVRCSDPEVSHGDSCSCIKERQLGNDVGSSNVVIDSSEFLQEAREKNDSLLMVLEAFHHTEECKKK